MKYVILIHSNPEPWGHPTADYLAAHQALPAEQRERLNTDFHELLTQMQADGELLGGEALGDPATARLVPLAGRDAAGHGRTVLGDQGAPGRLLPDRLPDARAGRGDRGAVRRTG